MSELAEPVDGTHEQSIVARHLINDAALNFKIGAAKWEPRPMPPGWRPDDEQR